MHNGPADSWMFYGDSITANQWAPGSFTQLINAATGYYPAASNGGVPFVTTNDAVSLFDRWLPLFPGTYVGIAYGTNDASGVAPSQFYSNMKALVDKVLARGKVPIIPTIPWASPSQRNDADIRALNAQIARLKSEYGGRVLDGPDLYSTLQNRPDLLTDGLHPNDAGNAAVSASRACDRAVSAVTVMKALSTGFKRSMRARQAFVCSTGDTIRDRTQLARLE